MGLNKFGSRFPYEEKAFDKVLKGSALMSVC